MSRFDHGTAAPDRARQLHDQLETAVADLVSSDDWRRMLEVASRFHDYSPNNVLLILTQRPEATRVAGYRTWQRVGRQVRRGARGIAILAPIVTRRRPVDDSDDADHPELARILRGFRIAHVFDISDTDGDPIDDVRPVVVEGDAPAGLWVGLAAQIGAAGFTLERADCGTANGRTDFSARTVTVRPDLPDAQAAKTLAHELAHVLSHDGTEYAAGCRGVVEVEAESVAYIVTAAAGLPAEGYSLPYVARWAAGDTALVRATAERAIKCARCILAALGQHGSELRA
jgi:hypothetical protein